MHLPLNEAVAAANAANTKELEQQLAKWHLVFGHLSLDPDEDQTCGGQ